MQPTQLTLLEQLSSGDEVAWSRADAIYRPMISSWLDQFGLQVNDRDDLTQDVMMTLSREIRRFQHGGQLGAFRSWLRTVTVNRARSFQRQGRLRLISNGSPLQGMIEDLGDDATALSKQFDREHDAYVARRLLNEVACEFAEETIKAFQLYVIDGQDVQRVADALGSSCWSVYQAKSRVLRRLRQRIGPWAAEMTLS